MSSTFRYQGNLRETTLPEMLYAIDRFRVPGVVRARSGEIVKRVYLRDGYVIHASSNDRRDSLGDFLRRQERLTETELEAVSRARSGSSQRFGVLLIEGGMVAPGEVYAAIREHVEEIVWSLFYWQRGEITFAIGEPDQDSVVQIQLPLRRVILEGIRRAPDAKPLVGRLGRKETVLEPCFRYEDLIEIALDADEFRLLKLVDGERSLYQLCAEGPFAAAENAKVLYAFQVMHLVRARRSESSGPVKIRLQTTGDAFGN